MFYLKDIRNTSPLTSAELSRFRNYLSNRMDNNTNLIVSVAITFMAHLGLVALGTSLEIYPWSFSIGYVIASAFIAPAIMLQLIARRHILKVDIGKLQLISDRNFPIAIEWCRNDPIIAKYQNAVVKQGRQLVEGEYWVMQEWMKLSMNEDHRNHATDKVSIQVERDGLAGCTAIGQ